MPVEQVPFDCAKPLREWIDDPATSVVDTMFSLLEAYSSAYRRAVIEIRRLEAANFSSARQHQGTGSEYSEIQKLIDESIAELDPDRE